MRYPLPTNQRIFAFCCLLLSPLFLLAQKPLDKSAIDQQVENHIFKTNKVYNWAQADDHLLWSALIHSDSVVSIGLVPQGYSSNYIKQHIHEIDFNAVEWVAARNKINNYILEITQAKYGADITLRDLTPLVYPNAVPFISIKVFDLEIIEQVRQMPEVRYFEPMGYNFGKPSTSTLAKSGEGCGGLGGPINSADYTNITPQARQSWHHLDHQVDQAWAAGAKGDGIWIVVIDTGVSDTNDKLNSEFAEGESSGRQIEKWAAYDPGGGLDGWQDQCGHGTAMSGLAAAPRGFDDSPAGIAYRANLRSYRATGDVIIGDTNEKAGVYNSLVHAGDEPKINIISMSIGDIFSSGVVEDGVVHAHNMGKLIFAAAGTSTTFTNWYGVIFPANMNETVAVTGVTDDPISGREKCDICHEGAEVDFVVCMERNNDSNRKGISIDRPDNSQGYVGGSSNATASMAGMAALVWSQNPTSTRGMVLNRLIENADYYPNRDGDFGWGKVNAFDAATFVPNICDPAQSNNVTLEITNITIPSSNDGFGGESEWVIELDGVAHYFPVDDDGVSGHPNSYIDLSTCGNLLMEFDLGDSNCGDATIPVTVTTYEDDSFSANCNFNSGDDHFASETINVNLTNTANTFTHNSPEGSFVFEYIVYCTPNPGPTASITGNNSLCENSSANSPVTFTGANGTAPYTFTYSLNGQTQTIVSAGNTATVNQSAATAGVYQYSLLNIQDADGCVVTASGVVTIVVNAPPTAVLASNSPICAGTPMILNASGGTSYQFFIDNNNNGLLDTGESLQTGASTSYTSNSAADGDVYGVIVTDANGCEANTTTTISLSPPITTTLTSNGPVCQGDPIILTAIPANMNSYQFFNDTNGNGSLDSGEILQLSDNNIYTSTTLFDGNSIGVIVTDSDGCTGMNFTTISILPLPTANITGTANICQGQSSNISFTGTPNAVVTYSDGANNSTITLDVNGTAIISVSPFSSTAYNLIDVSLNNCVNTATDVVVITVDPNPTVTISGDASICAGSNGFLIFSGTPNSNVSYFDGLSSSSITLDASGSAVIQVSPPATTSYQLLNITSPTGCTVPANGALTMLVTPLPNATIIGPTVICEGEPALLSIIGTPNAVVEYFDGSTFQSVTLGSNGSFDIPVNPLVTTTYSLVNATFNNCANPLTGFHTIAVIPLSDPACGGCPAFYNLTGTMNGVSDYETDGLIISNQTIGPNGQVDYDSGMEIELLPGFETILGAELDVFIDGCNGGSGGNN